MPRFLITALFVATIACFTPSCSSSNDDVVENIGDNDDTNNSGDTDDYVDTGDDELNGNSQTVNYDNMITIAYSATGATITNPFEGSGVTISNTDGHVVVNSSITNKELYYVLSGENSNASLKIYGEYKFNLVLNGVGITNPTGAAINIQCGKKISVFLQDNTNNRLIDGETYTLVDGEDMKATLFSEGQLNFYGEGSLELRGKYKHAICTDDYFRQYAGNITVKEAASDAVHTNEYIQIDGGTMTTRSVGEGFDAGTYIQINAGTLQITTSGLSGHGMKSAEYITVNSSGEMTITTFGTAAKCLSSDADMLISKGTLVLKTNGGSYYDTDDADISSPAGIKCDGNMIVDGGTLSITSTGAGGKGISVDGALTINNGTIEVSTSGGKYVYNSSNDTSAKGIKSDGNLTVNGGVITIKTTGEEAEGLESKDIMTIAGGELNIQTYDDAINATNHIEISGGKTYCYATNNDGIDSNGTITISGGTVVSSGTTQPEEGFDCDNNRFTITGGLLVGIGGATSSPTANYCTQYSLIYNMSSSSLVHIESTSTGAEILTFKLPRTYNSAVLLFSSSSLAKGTGYTIYTGGSVSGGTEFHGLYSGASYTKGTSAATFTPSSMVTTVGSTGGGGGRP